MILEKMKAIELKSDLHRLCKKYDSGKDESDRIKVRFTSPNR